MSRITERADGATDTGRARGCDAAFALLAGAASALHFAVCSLRPKPGHGAR